MLFPKAKKARFKGLKKSFGQRVNRVRGGLAMDRAVIKGTVAKGLIKAGKPRAARKVTNSALRDVGRMNKSRQRSIGALNSVKKYNKLRGMLNRNK